MPPIKAKRGALHGSKEMYTEDLSKFGYRELETLRDILDSYLNHGVPQGFNDHSMRPAFNMNSGYVFLINEDYDVLMLDDDKKLQYHLNCPECGNEGFKEDLSFPESGYGNQCCAEYASNYY